MHRDTLRVPFVAESLRHGLVPPWRHLEVVDETGSTNADLIARAAAGEDIDGAVLIAEHQTAGRGRQGRSWSDVVGAQITMSVGVDATAVPSEAWGWLPLATGIAIVDAIRDSTGIEAGLKWPNDVLAGPGKLAGILAEVAAPQRAIVVGFGLNVTLRPEEIAVAEATSLAELGVAAPDRVRLIAALLTQLGERVASWRGTKRTDGTLIADYRSRCLTLGTPVRAILPDNREITGVAEDVDEQGRLAIRSDGETIMVSAGDVVHLRRI